MKFSSLSLALAVASAAPYDRANLKYRVAAWNSSVASSTSSDFLSSILNSATSSLSSESVSSGLLATDSLLVSESQTSEFAATLTLLSSETPSLPSEWLNSSSEDTSFGLTTLSLTGDTWISQDVTSSSETGDGSETGSETTSETGSETISLTSGAEFSSGSGKSTGTGTDTSENGDSATSEASDNDFSTATGSDEDLNTTTCAQTSGSSAENATDEDSTGSSFTTATGANTDTPNKPDTPGKSDTVGVDSTTESTEKKQSENTENGETDTDSSESDKSDSGDSTITNNPNETGKEAHEDIATSTLNVITYVTNYESCSTGKNGDVVTQIVSQTLTRTTNVANTGDADSDSGLGSNGSDSDSHFGSDSNDVTTETLDFTKTESLTSSTTLKAVTIPGESTTSINYLSVSYEESGARSWYSHMCLAAILFAYVI